jgi:hypothetical protein
MTIVVTAIITAFVTAIATAYSMHRWILQPAKQKHQKLEGMYSHLCTSYERVYADAKRLGMELQDERRLRADLVKWIEIECAGHRQIERALKQRLDERLEALRQLQEQRRQLIP